MAHVRLLVSNFVPTTRFARDDKAHRIALATPLHRSYSSPVHLVFRQRAPSAAQQSIPFTSQFTSVMFILIQRQEQ